MFLKTIKFLSILALSFFVFGCNNVGNPQINNQQCPIEDLKKLQLAYPDYVKNISRNYLTWMDGTQMAVECNKIHNNDQMGKMNNPVLADQIVNIIYSQGLPLKPNPYSIENDPGRSRYLPFFMKMYGSTEEDVKKHLNIIYWLPKIFGDEYPLEVTTVNNVGKKLQQISDELEQLVIEHPDYKKYFLNPGGTFCWRVIAETNRLSPHSFGMTIDINTDYSNYWQWVLKKQGLPISETALLTYQNQIPSEIVTIFEKHGFIWGGKWYHYDTMHFEYRPELLIHS